MEYNIYKNRRNYGDSPAYLNPLGFLAGNPATLVVGGSEIYICRDIWLVQYGGVVCTEGTVMNEWVWSQKYPEAYQKYLERKQQGLK